MNFLRPVNTMRPSQYSTHGDGVMKIIVPLLVRCRLSARRQGARPHPIPCHVQFVSSRFILPIRSDRGALAAAGFYGG